ncbi:MULTISPECIES: UDP-N-acetylmuramoyl-L-alanyl-D-glutamate--2,6-diaminopimelate ligase [unclassified Pseudoxanthomonas]|uniref:UDP-N-acetylmuramoyl-L-alanyl-D-glutamate--2, 6-diaminopimelate ligase n=1 Tax=unclassified Pseudoxanthomonas TaxID=2645906 RepID=UPI0016153446|nr:MULTISPECIES: UDP-N-acetylmuramoyl-L-alanyl-D-glutamate--2,6-diaminopimelate ligase [unclassified Pseudoxanthomonas]MBB3275507.1 UDP-N-acetylmuramoyl-L-alanyl-D-glutamate--2,6-diaminopimelate ligase [Pseudoxanthomonas sp. OG2]MBV7473405.1 UDP-N-acetylmuramoyl-L-alanyl-D-glutamate--2,6-diaminopimelate ligase [Pseudoxanthomonas sp. PXM05]
MRRMMALAELLPDVDVPRDIVVRGLVQDSRTIEPGDAFVAIAGFGAHGLNFVEQARQKGASAILYEPPAPPGMDVPRDAIAVPGLRARMGAMADRFHAFPSRDMKLVGVTGTNGKTSTVQLLAQAWHIRGTRCGSIGTLGAGMYGEVVPTGFTTPLVLQMHALLAQLRDAGAKAVAMEVSSHALDQGRVDGVHFDVGVFTNLTRDHLDYHGDMATYGAAKARLFAWPELKAAVINLDDEYGRVLYPHLPGAVQGVGVSSRGQESATLRADALRLDASGIAFDLATGGESHPVQSRLLGRFNVDNLLAVAGVLYALGEAPQEIARTLSRLQPIHGRMNRLGGNVDEQGRRLPLIVIDYAHTPDALEQALSSLRDHAGGRLICVFGCGGERDAGKRPQMAAAAERLADRVFVTDDNPRGEDGDRIVADIVAGFTRPDAVTVLRDRRLAIERAVGEAGENDIVLIAGKGHEPYQEINGVKHPFDDTAVARQALEARA